MSNSPLVDYTKISPNKTINRSHVIDTISIHCTAGQTTVQALGNLFSNPEYKASSNYGIGYDGKIGMYVEESDRSWCTSSSANDRRAVTIEVSSDNKDPYAVNEAAYNALIDLLVDICHRNPGIGRLRWKGDKSLIGQVDKQNMTVHRWFANKACCGDWLYSRHGQIAAEVNKRLDELEDENMTGEEIYNKLMEYLRSLPTSDYAKESSAKGVKSGYFSDGDGDGLVDDPHAPLKRQELATVLNRMGLLDK